MILQSNGPDLEPTAYMGPMPIYRIILCVGQPVAWMHQIVRIIPDSTTVQLQYKILSHSLSVSEDEDEVVQRSLTHVDYLIQVRPS